MSDNSVHLGRLPGWDKYSYGYHADDGKVFCASSNTGEPYGPTFTTGDTIGCGINLIDRSIFYTKNGIHLGTYVCGISCQLIECLLVHRIVGIAFKDIPVSSLAVQYEWGCQLSTLSGEHEVVSGCWTTDSRRNRGSQFWNFSFQV